MSRDRRAPLGAAIGGLVAGAVGTAVMTAAQTAYYKAMDVSPSSTPAEVGKRIAEGVLQREVSDATYEKLNTGMHVLYGTSLGLAYGLLAGNRSPRVLVGGTLFGAGVWGWSSGVMLPAMQLAPPIWESGPAALAPDLGFHVVYGLGVAAGYRALVER